MQRCTSKNVIVPRNNIPRNGLSVGLSTMVIRVIDGII